MSLPDPSSSELATLSTALRAIRRRQGLKVAEIAGAMGLPPRSYQLFEAGRSHLHLWPRIRAFAEATASDPHAIVAAMTLGAPDLALHSLDNKLVSILMVGLARFEARLGEGLARFEAARLIAAVRKLFDELEADLRARESDARAWLQPPDDEG